jgi:heparosan-N-sulfate-glucuronate 5-epimerase
MRLRKRLNYYQRIFAAYLGSAESQLTFWHDVPAPNPNLRAGELGEYYQGFEAKADYRAHLDATGIPMLDYRGAIGPQYNPIAIAQYGLGNFNLWVRTKDPDRRRKFLAVADWLLANLVQNAQGRWVWMHHFDFEYRDTLRAPWYSGLAQGQGVSLLVRAWKDTGEAKYLDAAHRAFETMLGDVKDGGTLYTDGQGRPWIEEYIVSPPTHILNGFMWATWGVYDYWLATNEARAREFFESVLRTLAGTLPSYDVGFWSLYEHSGTTLPMIASGFYHRLHIAQLEVLHRITGEPVFGDYAERWRRYTASPWKRKRALVYKAVFKLCHY